MALYAAAQVSATREEEAKGYLDNLLVRLVSEQSGSANVSLSPWSSLVVLGLSLRRDRLDGYISAGQRRRLDETAGGRAEHRSPGNPGPRSGNPGPRFAAAPFPLAYGLIAWSFLVELVGSMVKANHYFMDLSIFHHMALAPAAEIRWDSAAIFVGFGIVAAVLRVLFLTGATWLACDHGRQWRLRSLSVRGSSGRDRRFYRLCEVTADPRTQNQ